MLGRSRSLLVTLVATLLLVIAPLCAVVTGGYRPDPDFPMITWTEDNAGRAIFYYEGELNDRFMKVHT